MATSFGVGRDGDRMSLSHADEKNMRNKSQEKGKGHKGAQQRAKGDRPSTPVSQAKNGQPHKARGSRGVSVVRVFTQPNIDPLSSRAPGLPTLTGQPTELVYERRSSVITNPDGSIVFKMEGAEIPSSWSQLATDIVISKYFRKAGMKKPGTYLSEGPTPTPVGRIATPVTGPGRT